MTDEQFAAAYEAARLSVLHGVTWSGTTESAGGVTKDEALSDAVELIDELERRGGIHLLLPGQ